MSQEKEIKDLGELGGDVDLEFLTEIEKAGKKQQSPDTKMKPEELEVTESAETAKPTVKKEEVSFSLNMDLGAVVVAATEKILERDIRGLIEPLIKAEAAKMRPIYIKVGEQAEIKMEETLHKSFKELLFLATQEKQVMLVGPAGSGKTTLGGQIAKGLKLEFGFISCSAGMSEAHLLGRMLFDGAYVASDFVRTYENGGVFLFDEIDAADANTLLVINSALANGILSLPNRKEQPFAKRHKDFICIVSGNSWGNGSVEYQGRGYLDAAFLDRFACSKMEIDYDKDLEKMISEEFPEIAETFWKFRENVKKNSVRRIISTRAIVSGMRQRKAGKPLTAIVDTFMKGWTPEEIKKVIG